MMNLNNNNNFNKNKLNYLNYGNIFKFGKTNLHTSAVLYSNGLNEREQIIVDRIIAASNEVLPELQVVKYEGFTGTDKNTTESEPSSSDLTSYDEAFPFLIGHDGERLEFNQPISLFNGVKLISNFINKKFEMDKDLISDVKITELLQPFEKNDRVTVLELFNHVSKMYNQDKNSFNKIVDTTTSTSDDYVQDVNNNLVKVLKDNKPLGSYGDVTLNQIAVSVKELEWETILNGTKLTIHALPAAVNMVSYGLMLRTYLNLVHNRPFKPNLSITQYQKEVSHRRRNLGAFVLIGLPLAGWFFRYAAISVGDMFSISYAFGSPTSPQIDNNSPASPPVGGNITNSSSPLFLLLSKINKKIPTWLRVAFNLMILTIVVLKLLGFSSIFDFFNNSYYLKVYLQISCSLVIIYQLLNIGLLYFFIKKNPKIPEYLPEFIINWLKEYEEMSKFPKSFFKEFKTTAYIEIGLYLTILILTFLIG